MENSEEHKSIYRQIPSLRGNFLLPYEVNCLGVVRHKYSLRVIEPNKNGYIELMDYVPMPGGRRTGVNSSIKLSSLMCRIWPEYNTRKYVPRKRKYSDFTRKITRDNLAEAFDYPHDSIVFKKALQIADSDYLQSVCRSYPSTRCREMRRELMRRLNPGDQIQLGDDILEVMRKSGNNSRAYVLGANGKLRPVGWTLVKKYIYNSATVKAVE